VETLSEDQTIQRLDAVDKLLRWQIAAFSAVATIAVYSASMNFRLTAIETDRSSRIPSYELFRAQTEQTNTRQDTILANVTTVLSVQQQQISEMQRDRRSGVK